MNRRLVRCCEFLLFCLLAFPVYASCKVTLVAEVQFAPKEATLGSGLMTILRSYAERVAALDVDVVVVYPVRSKCESSNFCSINAKRVKIVKSFLVENGIPENKIFAFPNQKTVESSDDSDVVLVESIGSDRRCLAKELERGDRYDDKR